MMLSPNGLLNPKASMPQPHPPPLPVITHTAATPTINSSQSRRASAASMDINTIEQRTPVRFRHMLLHYLHWRIITLNISSKVNLQRHSNRVTESFTCAVQRNMMCVAALFSRRCSQCWYSLSVWSCLGFLDWIYFGLCKCPCTHWNLIFFFWKLIYAHWVEITFSFRPTLKKKKKL